MSKKNRIEAGNTPIYCYSLSNSLEYVESIIFFSTCALLHPRFSAILFNLSLYPFGKCACTVSVFSAIYREFAAFRAGVNARLPIMYTIYLLLLLKQKDMYSYPLHKIFYTLSLFFSFFKLRVLCMYMNTYPCYTIAIVAGTTTKSYSPRLNPKNPALASIKHGI